MNETHHNTEEAGQTQLPTPTVWPLVLALGVSLMLAGMVTSVFIGVLGLVLALAGAVGWFRQVLPQEAHEPVKIRSEDLAIAARSSRTLMAVATASSSNRQVLAAQTFRISTGLIGGIAGGIAMTVPAGIFSVIRYHSLWYATNLLAAGGFVSWASASDAFLSQFHWQGALAALVIHATTSLLVGLLYGAMLMMFPRYPILTAGFMVPLLFTAILYTALGVVSPILNQRIDWWWFVPSQLFFGLVCGYVVNLRTNVRTPQFRALPFSVRAGLHGDRAAMAHEDHRGPQPTPSSAPTHEDKSK